MTLTGLENNDLELIIFSGKGGVGKTSCAIATALALSEKVKTLLISTNPTHSVSDCLEQQISFKVTQNDGTHNLVVDTHPPVIVLAATNRIDLIDPALPRSGRFDLILELPLPDLTTGGKIFDINTRNKPIGKKVNLNKLALKTEKLTRADNEFICHNAACLPFASLIE